MIEYLSGVCRAKNQTGIVVDVQGVGYGVDTPISTLCEIGSVGSKVELWIETQVREDAIKLFGFATQEEKQLFGMLRSVNGVGPKIALALLSALDCKLVRQAVFQERKDIFESVPGVGKRLAERLVLELRAIFERSANGLKKIEGAKAKVLSPEFDEFEGGSESDTQLRRDVESALVNLGYKEKEVHVALEKISSADVAVDFNQWIKKALVELRSNF